MELSKTSLVLPNELIEAAGVLVREGKAPSIDEFVARALRHEIQQVSRGASLDEQFRAMETDPDYQCEARKLLDEFAGTDAETFNLE